MKVNFVSFLLLLVEIMKNMELLACFYIKTAVLCKLLKVKS